MCKANTDFFFLVCTPAHPFMYFRILFVHTHDRLDAAAAVGLNSVQGLISNTSIWTLIHMPHTVECISGAVANIAIEKPKRQWIDKNTTSLWRLFRFYRRMFSWTVSCPFIMSVCGVCIVHVCVCVRERESERANVFVQHGKGGNPEKPRLSCSAWFTQSTSQRWRSN